MDLVSGISNLQVARTYATVQTRVAKKILDTQEMQGQAVLKLLDAATQGVAQAGDSLVAAATGLGGQIDTYG